ncbi:hypothetical protein L2E82_19854 [Cichorium intybus]|uniref:Uncharacterized protein n=1 Tax=Cichorium intybus TaxID=13427 RepID=A0ACB9DSH7_CICIN|nr:hypothetical protein L2E82_19854 [Cichorium intybus]
MILCPSSGSDFLISAQTEINWGRRHPGFIQTIGTVITGEILARIIFLTALETTKVAAFKMVEPFKLSDPTKGVFVPIDVILERKLKVKRGQKEEARIPMEKRDPQPPSPVIYLDIPKENLDQLLCQITLQAVKLDAIITCTHALEIVHSELRASTSIKYKGWGSLLGFQLAKRDIIASYFDYRKLTALHASSEEVTEWLNKNNPNNTPTQE